jgi:hypothetical protein
MGMADEDPFMGRRLRALDYRVLIRTKAKTAEGLINSGRSPIKKESWDLAMLVLV